MASNKITSTITNKYFGRIVENFVLIWLDSNIKEKPNAHHKALDSIQHFVNTVVLISDEDEYFALIEQIKHEKLFVIISSTLGERLAQIVESNPEIHSVYVYSAEPTYHDKWTKQYQKVKGYFTRISPICDALRRDIRQANNDLIPINILSPINLDQLFISSIILKDILLNSDYNKQTPKEFLRFCRKHYANNTHESKIIDEYMKKNEELTPIQWYTRECFIYSMLNRALRLYDVEILTLIIFFIQDLHKQITEIHAKSNEQQLTVYHGQRLSNDQFSNLQKSIDSLITFNTFLMAIINKEVPLSFAQQFHNDLDIKYVLFKIEIDRTQSSYPFVMLDQLDYCQDTDRYVLFSLDAVFQIKKIHDVKDHVRQIDLVLVKNDDKNIKMINNWIDTKFGKLDGFLRLAEMMIYTGEIDKAKTLCNMLLDSTHDEIEKLAVIHHQLGCIEDKKLTLESALTHYTESYKFRLKLVSKNDPTLCQLYVDMGIIKSKLGLFDEALEDLKNAVDIEHHAQEVNSSRISCCLFNIGSILYAQGKFTEMCIGLQQAIKIYQKKFSPNDNLRAEIYYNLSIELEKIGEYRLAIRHATIASDIANNISESNDYQTKMYEEHLQKLYQYLGTV